MRLKAKVLLALVVSLGAALAHADPPARTGRLNYVHGTVSFAAAQAPDAWAIATLNRPLTTGDRLWTDRDGYAELHVGSTAVRLAPRTNLDILSLDDHTLQLRVAQGDVNVRVREVSDDAIEIDTPGGAVLLEEPGSYRINTLPSDDATSVIVHAGRAHVLTQHSAFSVHANQQVTLRGVDGAPSEIADATMDAFDRWSADLDKREDQIAATRYVSPQMTGYEDLDAYGTWRSLPEYGAVWVPTVSAGWAPYRYGHWVWIEPWGWTWVDDAPWGFAPFHYGRWVWLHSYWAWAPGPRIARPVYAPAMVAFVGGSQWSVSIGSGPAVGWFPLGWREPFLPWYRTSPTYVRNVNITQVKNINVYNNVTRINYVNRSVPQAVTVVTKETFVSARPVARSAIRLPAGHATRAPLLKSTPAEPAATSFIAQRTDSRPPEAATRREVFATRTPPGRDTTRSLPSTSPGNGRTEGRGAAPGAEPRLRIIERQRTDMNAPGRQRAEDTPRESTPGAMAPGTTTRAPQAEVKPQPKATPQTPQAADRGPRPKEARPQPRTDAQRDEQRPPQSSRVAPPRNTPDPAPRAESAPNRAPPRAQSDAQRERRAPGPPPDARSQSRAEREPRAERGPAPSEPHTRPSNRNEREVQRERRPPPVQNRQQRPDASAPHAAPRAGGPPQPAVQPPRAPQPQARAPHPETRSPRHAPPPRASNRRPERERNRND